MTASGISPPPRYSLDDKLRADSNWRPFYARPFFFLRLNKSHVAWLGAVPLTPPPPRVPRRAPVAATLPPAPSTCSATPRWAPPPVWRPCGQPFLRRGSAGPALGLRFQWPPAGVSGSTTPGVPPAYLKAGHFSKCVFPVLPPNFLNEIACKFAETR